jgi:hypothetical protein
MLPSNSTSAETKRKVESMIRRARVRTVLLVSGVSCLGMGVLCLWLPFGPSLENRDFIPKIDPDAGTRLLQSLPLSDLARVVGMGLLLLGVVLFCFLGVFGSDPPATGSDRDA